MTTKFAYAMSFLLGLGMIFIGVRFFYAPEAATAAYGIHFNAGGDHSFHHIKGIRDIFSGILLTGFVIMNQRKAVGFTLTAGGLIPVIDMLVVLDKPYNGLSQAMPHLIAILICFVFGLLLLFTEPQQKI